MGEEQGLSAENWATLERVFGTDWTALAIDWRFLNRLLNAARSEGLQPPVGVGVRGGPVLAGTQPVPIVSGSELCVDISSLGASKAPSSGPLDMTERLHAAVAAYKALPPVEKALHDAAQKRSFVRGQCGRDPGPDVLAEEVLRLRALLAQTGSPTDCQTSGGEA